MSKDLRHFLQLAEEAGADFYVQVKRSLKPEVELDVLQLKLACEGRCGTIKPIPRCHAARVAIAGSGPAGLSAAYFLVKIGYGVTVFEKMSQLGGMLRTIMEYRLPRDILNSQINYLRDIGVEFSTDTAIGPDLSLGDLKANGYKAVFLAFGAPKSRKSHYRTDFPKRDNVNWLKNIIIKKKEEDIMVFTTALPVITKIKPPLEIEE